MSNESTTPLTIEAINELLSRVGAVERQPTAWSRGDLKMFYGTTANLPSGWWPCDGTTAPDGVATPDLRGRTPFGLKSTDTAFDVLGESGGAAAINLQHGHTGAAHDHTIAHTHADAHAHDVTGNTIGVFESGSSNGHDLDTTVTLTHGGTDKVARDLHTHAIQIASTVSQSVSTTGAASTGTSGAAAYTGSTGNALSATQSILPPYAVVNFAYRYV